jgi:hypothetical protein
MSNASDAQAWRGEWLLRNACLAYMDSASAAGWASHANAWHVPTHGNSTRGHAHWSFKLMLFRTSDTAPDARLSAKSWPPLFVEGTGEVGEQSRAAHRKKGQRAQRERAAQEAERWPRQWHDTAFVTALTMDNLWHSVFHALPISERHTHLAHALAAPPEGVDLWPWFTTYPAWSSNVSQWVGWQVLARSLLPAPSLLGPGCAARDLDRSNVACSMSNSMNCSECAQLGPLIASGLRHKIGQRARAEA